MALKDTINQVRQILIGLCHDLEKAAEGNRAARAQRVRTGSMKFTKVGKGISSRRNPSHKKKGQKKGQKKSSKKNL